MILTGLARLGRDAELRHAPSGDPVTNLSLAYNWGRKDDATGKKPTQWVDAALWGPLAQALAPYLLKGTAVDVIVEDVRIETFPTRAGGEGHKLSGRVMKIELAGGGEQREGQAPAPSSRAAAPAPRPAARPADGVEDDDIPF